MGPDSTDPLVGTVLAGHHIERVLGAGGMGTVYLARHLELDKLFALKTIRTDATPQATHDQVAPRFRQEMRILSRLDHPNIVSTASAGVVGSTLWFTMTYVEGHDVASLLTGQTLTCEQAVSIIESVAAALDHAHGRGVVHRDVKPGNILVSEQEPGERRVMLTDFGIASMRQHLPSLTTSGVPFTLQYAAPEQLAGEPVESPADIYALAATLHTLLTGQPPFPDLPPAAVMKAHFDAPRPQASVQNPSVPASLDAVVAKGMDPSAAGRYPTAGDLAADARLALTSGSGHHRSMAMTVRATPTGVQPTPAVPAPTPRRRQRTVAAVTALCVIVLTGTSLLLWGQRRADSDPSPPTTSGQSTTVTRSEASLATPTTPVTGSGDPDDADAVAMTALMTPAPTVAQVTVGGSIRPGAVVATVPPKACDGDPARLTFDLDGRYSALAGVVGVDAGAAAVNTGMWIEKDGVDQTGSTPQLIVRNGEAATFSIPATNVRRMTLRLQAMGSTGNCNGITAALYDLVGQR